MILAARIKSLMILDEASLASQVWGLALQPPHAGLGIRHSCSHRLLNLVSQGGR